MKGSLIAALAGLALASGGCVSNSRTQGEPAAAPAALGQAGITLVEGGQPRAVVVTADAPSRMAAYAVEERVAHVKKASAATLPVAKESAVPEVSHRNRAHDRGCRRSLTRAAWLRTNTVAGWERATTDHAYHSLSRRLADSDPAGH